MIISFPDGHVEHVDYDQKEYFKENYQLKFVVLLNNIINFPLVFFLFSMTMTFIFSFYNTPNDIVTL